MNMKIPFSLQTMLRTAFFAAALWLFSGVFQYAGAQSLPHTQLNVVGGLSSRLTYLDVERPFWTESIAQRSSGAITAQIKGFDELGLKGKELLRLMSQGVIEFGVLPLSYFAPETSLLEAVDIAGLTTDSKLAKETVTAFTPILSQQFATKNQIKLLGLAPYGAQIFFCNAPIRRLADLRGQIVRTITRTQAELVEAFGAKSVSLPFNEVIQAFESKTITCAVAGALTGYTAKWYSVSTHLYVLPVGWNQEIHAVNQIAWDKLSEPTQRFIESNVDELIQNLWAFAEKLTQRGIACNTGNHECTTMPRGNMTLVTANAADLALVKRLATQKVLPKWAERCTDSCVTDFNQTIGKQMNVQAKK